MWTLFPYTTLFRSEACEFSRGKPGFNSNGLWPRNSQCVAAKCLPILESPTLTIEEGNHLRL
jgi:hypothetical protein